MRKAIIEIYDTEGHLPVRHCKSEVTLRNGKTIEGAIKRAAKREVTDKMDWDTAIVKEITEVEKYKKSEL